MQSKNHWQRVYETKPPTEVSWFQEHAGLSLKLIEDTRPPRTAAIIDVGGGASTLVDDLLARAYENLTVLDISAAALAAAKSRLGSRAGKVRWLEADILDVELAEHAYDVWHDRAVFHFLTAVEQRRAYVRKASHSLKPGGFAIVATFAEDGPKTCSGLPVMRYSAQQLGAEFGRGFTLLRHEREAHETPAGRVQHFVYCVFRSEAS